MELRTHLISNATTVLPNLDLDVAAVVDRYAACCENLVLVVRPHSGPARGARQRKLATSQGDPRGYQGAEPLGWLVVSHLCLQ
jgi:hypothetical protein